MASGLSTYSSPTVLITGASSGIGQAAALRFALEGWHVFATVRKHEDLEALEQKFSSLASGTSSQCSALGLTTSRKVGPALTEQTRQGQLTVVILDVTDEASVKSGVAKVKEAVGDRGLNVLINNAGIAVFGPIETTSVDDWRKVFEINVYGLATMTRYCLPLLRQAAATYQQTQQQRPRPKVPAGMPALMPARVINIGSAAGRLAGELQSVYSASKHAVEAITDALRLELNPQHIEVVCMELGVVATSLGGKLRTQSGVVPGPGSSAPTLSALQASPEIADIYQPQIKSALELFDAIETQTIPMKVVLDAMLTASTRTRPATRYIVDGQIAMTLWLRWILPDRWWDSFYRWADGIAKSRGKKNKAKASAGGGSAAAVSAADLNKTS